MSTDKANYKGGQGSLHEGLKTHSPPVYDSSRAPIGSKHPDVNEGAVRKDVGEVKPSTIGPRTA